jgi:hypothetical protein
MLRASIVTDPAQRRTSRRRDRYAARFALWKITNLKRVAACGRFATDVDGGVQVRVSGSTADGTRRAGFRGVQSCGSTWACPVCSEKIQAERQHDVSRAIATWTDSPGREVVFLTLTMRHHQGQSLEDLWNGVSSAWRATTSGSRHAWEADRADFGVSHYLRVVEVTHGRNGWHVHVHALLFLDRSNRELAAGEPINDHELYRLRRSLFGRWRDSLRSHGFDAWEQVGVDVRRVVAGDSLGAYFAKSTYKGTTAEGAAFEVTGSVSKRAGHGRTPFQILRACVEPGDVEQVDGDVALWREWERVSKGRRQLVWSRGLRDAVGLTVELTDVEVVETDRGGERLADLGDQWKLDHLARKAVRLLEWAEADDTGETLRRELRKLAAAAGRQPPDPRDG